MFAEVNKLLAILLLRRQLIFALYIREDDHNTLLLTAWVKDGEWCNATDCDGRTEVGQPFWPNSTSTGCWMCPTCLTSLGCLYPLYVGQPCPWRRPCYILQGKEDIVFFQTSTALPNSMARLIQSTDVGQSWGAGFWLQVYRLISHLTYHPPGNPIPNWSWERLKTQETEGRKKNGLVFK